MAANSCDVEAVVHDRCFFMDFDFAAVMKGSRRNILPSSPFLSLIVQISSPYLTPFTSYIQAPIVYFPYTYCTNQSVLLLLCRTVKLQKLSEYEAETLTVYTFGYVDYKNVIKWSLKMCWFLQIQSQFLYHHPVECFINSCT